MTTQEFKNEFNILYDGVASKGAPGLDDYEISVFLTNAQREIINNKYNPKSNKLQEGFEQTSKRRTELKNLLKDYKNTIFFNNNENIEEFSKFSIIPSDVFIITFESAKIVDSCGDTKKVDVKSKTLDEYNVQRNNPFKKPNNKKIWRIDYNNSNGNNVVELISEDELKEYHIRYIKNPKPIIITDLTVGDFTNENLTIEGYTKPMTSELDPSVHIEILNRAVELATLSYKESSLNNFVNLNQRNE